MRPLDRLRAYRLSPRGRTWLVRGVALVGFGLLAKVLLETGIVGAGGRGGYDATAYWSAARRVVDGLPLYGAQTGAFGAYLYPPLLAQILAPGAFLPLPVFVWTWRLIELVSLRIAVGSWVRAGIAMLFPPVVAEIDAGNVHLIMAGACAAVMRNNGVAIGPAVLLKFAALPLVPLGWLRDRRGLVVGGLITGAVAAVSFALSPASWTDYFGFVGTLRDVDGFWNLAVAFPFPFRLVAALALGLLAIRWIRLAPIAVVLAYPIVWFSSLSTFVALVAPVSQRDRREKLRVAPTASTVNAVDGRAAAGAPLGPG
jgi:hypothetical protein